MCPACRKTLTNALRLCHLRGCGHVVCAGCVEVFVKPEQRCVCGQEAMSADCVRLDVGGMGLF